MITKKAMELAEIAKNPGQSEEEEVSSYSNFMDELYSNCDPTFEELSRLVGNEFFGVKNYYEFHFKNLRWKRVFSVGARTGNEIRKEYGLSPLEGGKDIFKNP